MLRSSFARTISTSTKLTSNSKHAAATANACKTKKKSSEDYRKNIERCITIDNCPLPLVIKRGKGVQLYDVEGKSYLDFISANCSITIGHCHPKIAKVVAEQSRILTHASKDLFTTALADYGEFITDLFGYDKVLPTCTGTEACEAAVKVAKEWGYKCKGICANKAKILIAENSYWGRSTEKNEDSGSGCIETVPFSDASCLECKARDPNVCAFMVEPIQGEAGIIIPDPCYLKQVKEICTRHRVLFIADEIQCGLGRAGCMLCCGLYKVRPDILVLGKGLSAGFMPVAAVLADCEIMDHVEGQSVTGTFAGSALGCVIASETLKIIQEENLVENARSMGEMFRGALGDLPRDIVCEVRGVGLMNAIVLNGGINLWDLMLDMMSHGLLAKASKGQVIRFCPPLCINENEVMKATKIIRHCIENSRGSCGGNDGGSIPEKPKKGRGKKKKSSFFDLKFKDLNVTAKLAESLKKFRINCSTDNNQ